MGWIFVIEEDQAMFEQVEEAVSHIEPKLSILRFPNSHTFLDWMTHFIAGDKAISPPIPADQFRGIITSVEAWKFRDVQLIQKFKPLFIQKGLAQTEEELSVVFTGYEADVLNKKRFEHRSVNNFIFKPFDKLVLKQMLEIAFAGRAPIKKYYVHNLKMDKPVEMLKEIVSTGLTELGFHTVSEEPPPQGRITKFYAKFLETNQHRSALAQVVNVVKLPTPGPKPYRVYLRFFALDQRQSFNLQKLVKEKSKNHLLPQSAAKTDQFEFIFLAHPKSSLCQEVQPSAERFFNHPIREVMDPVHLGKELSEKVDESDFLHRFIFVDHQHIVGNEIAELEAIRKVAKNPNLSLFVLSQKIFPEPMELQLAEVCEDIFYSPFNRSYLMKGLKQRWPQLQTKEDLFEGHREFDQEMHVSNPVKLEQVSEAGLIIEYNRELTVGSFREFVFWMPDEASVPTLIAQCNANTPVEGKKTFHCHFVFFGLHDHELKHIRLWMRHEYVESKHKDEN